MPRPGFYSFYCSTSACLARRFPWHVLSKQRSCPLIPGFSSIRAWVTQPRHWYDFLTESESQTVMGRALGIQPLYKGTKAQLLSFNPIKFASRLEFQHPKLQIQALRTFDDVRLRPPGPVDAFLCYGRRHVKVKRCQVSYRRNLAQAACPRSGHSHSQAR